MRAEPFLPPGSIFIIKNFYKLFSQKIFIFILLCHNIFFLKIFIYKFYKNRYNKFILSARVLNIKQQQCEQPARKRHEEETMSKNTKQQALEARIAELEAQLKEATEKKGKTSHRKYEVLALLKEGPHSTSELAVALNTSKNNIGSLLSYLRTQDNIVIHRNHHSQHYLPATE